MELYCPICQRLLKQEEPHIIGTQPVSQIDYHCFPSKDDHHYAVRMQEDQMIFMKIRLSPQETKLFLSISFVGGFSEVWTKARDSKSRMRINHAFMPDFSDLSKLEKKIRTYLLFS